MAQADIIDSELVGLFRSRALRRAHGGEEFLLIHALEDITERLSAVEREFEHGLLITPMASYVGAHLPAGSKVMNLTYFDTIANPDEFFSFDAEQFDLVLSVLTLQDANDVPCMLIRMRRLLKPDGLMLAVMLGGDTLTELRQALTQAECEVHDGASPRVLPFADVRMAGALLQRAGFSLPVTDAEKLTVRYDDMFALMRDLRGMGAQNALIARSRRPASRRLFQRAADIYAQMFSDPDDRVRATFSFISLSGWAPHESQQKPLRPGSARVSLASILEKR